MKAIKTWNEYINEQKGPGGETWILYYLENYVPHFISAHTSENEAEAAWYDAIEDRFGDEIQEWMEGNLPSGVRSLDDLEERSPKAYNRLHREGVEWASDELASYVEFGYDTLGEIEQRDDWDTELYDQFRQEMEASM
jgi:hypothetical protein